MAQTCVWEWWLMHWPSKPWVVLEAWIITALRRRPSQSPDRSSGQWFLRIPKEGDRMLHAHCQVGIQKAFPTLLLLLKPQLLLGLPFHICVWGSQITLFSVSHLP